MFYADMWADQPVGNCAKGKPGELDDLMFESRSPVPGPNNPAALEAQRNYREAKRMCVGCPLQEQCLEQGMRPENLHTYAGVWGGLTAGERMLLVSPRSTHKAAQWARFMRDLEQERDAEKERQRRAARSAARWRQREAAKRAKREERRAVCKRGHDLAEHGKLDFDPRAGKTYMRCRECKRMTDRVLSRPASSTPCSVEGCGSFTYAAGLCQPHYRRELRQRKASAA